MKNSLTVTATYCLRDFLHFDIFNIKVLLMIHAKFQPNIASRTGEKFDFIGFAIFKWQISICHFSLASAFSKHFRLTLPLKNESAQNAIHFLLNCRVSFNKSIFSEESFQKNVC